MSEWKIFQGNSTEPHDGIGNLPKPPPWRPWRSEKNTVPVRDIIPDPQSLGHKFKATEQMVQVVNAALYLRRPLLLTGKPGSGKSSLIEAVAWELNLGKVLRWSVTSRSTLKDALYEYDALGRLQEQQLQEANDSGKKTAPDIGEFLRLGPLGTALLPSVRPRALLIDEIDKADIDLPNDLLNVFERGEFTIAELARLKQDEVKVREYDSDRRFAINKGQVTCHEFPFVVLTSNGEREFPAPFLRRCIRFDMPQPDYTMLTDIVKTYLGDAIAAQAATSIREFAERSQDRALATDQLLNAIFLTTSDRTDTDNDRQAVAELLLKELNVQSS